MRFDTLSTGLASGLFAGDPIDLATGFAGVMISNVASAAVQAVYRHNDAQLIAPNTRISTAATKLAEMIDTDKYHAAAKSQSIRSCAPTLKPSCGPGSPSIDTFGRRFGHGQ